MWSLFCQVVYWKAKVHNNKKSKTFSHDVNVINWFPKISGFNALFTLKSDQTDRHRKYLKLKLKTSFFKKAFLLGWFLFVSWMEMYLDLFISELFFYKTVLKSPKQIFHLQIIKSRVCKLDTSKGNWALIISLLNEFLSKYCRCFVFHMYISILLG